MISTRQQRARTRRALAAVAASCLVFAACSNSSNDDSGGADTTAAATEDTTADTTPADTTADTEPADTTATDDTEPADTTADTEPSSDEPNIGTFEPVEGVPGVTDEAINFAVLGTGPSNPLGYCLLECFAGGVQAFFDYQNSIGGVNGRDLVISRTDDDEVGNTQVKALELIEDDSIFGIFGAPLQYAGWADIGAAGVPLYTTFPAAGDANGFDNIYIPTGTQCVECATPSAVHAANLAGATTAASIGFGVSQASKDCVNRTESDFLTFGPGVDIGFGYKNDDLPFGFPNGLGPEVTAMKEAGVDFISTCIDQNSVLILEQELERQGMGDVVVALPQGYADAEFISTNAALLEGDIMGVPYRPFEADPGDSNIQTMLDAFEASGIQLNDYAIQGWMGAQLAAEGIIAAGPQFDRETVVAATNTFTDWTNMGMTPPVDWSTAHTAPAPDAPFLFCSTYVRVTKGAFEMASDPAKPWDCFNLPLDAWEPPTSMDF
jgi:branched-chain amino acid transport system substrate-binding protein